MSGRVPREVRGEHLSAHDQLVVCAARLAGERHAKDLQQHSKA